MNLEEFESWTVGVEVAEVDGIAVTEACAVEQSAIVVEGC